jgi:hypothetical protein
MENLWVATKALLAQLEPTLDGDEIGVFENNSIYSYDSTSSATEDGDNYIAPPSDVGMWVKTRTFALANHNHLYTHYTKAQVDALLALKAAANHNHDDSYYSKSVVDALLSTLAKTTDVVPSSEFMPALPDVFYIAISQNDDPPIIGGNYGLWVDNVNGNAVLKFFNGTTNKTITFDVD